MLLGEFLGRSEIAERIVDLGQLERRIGGSRVHANRFAVLGGGPVDVAESFRGSPARLAPVPDMREWSRSVLTGLVADEQGVRDLASPEPPELGTLPRLYQIQERITKVPKVETVEKIVEVPRVEYQETR